MSYLFILTVLIFAASTYCVADETDPGAWGIRDDRNSELENKVTKLKQQALRILGLKGAHDLNNVRVESAGTKWDDIQMTDDLASDLANSFDTEQKELEAAKQSTGDDTDTDRPRATAPDFNMIPYAKWDSMPIKYSISLVQTPALKRKIQDALNTIQTSAGCITFEQVTTKPSTSFILYREAPSLGPGVCADSALGRQPDVNVINVATTCQVTGTLIHETLHSLGFAHTMQRPDVDQFLTVSWNNINPQAATNFKPWRYALRDQGPFDYGSILMYPKNAFAMSPLRDTLIPKQNARKNSQLMGQREQLSAEDINIIKKIYCGGRGSTAGERGESESPAPRGECKNQLLLMCPYFKMRGYCQSTSGFAHYVQKNCVKACNLC